MDATISTARNGQSTRYQIGLDQVASSNNGREVALAQAGLFEQILSLPISVTPIEPPRSEPSRSESSASDEPSAAERSDEASQRDPSESDEADDTAAAAAAVDQQAAALAREPVLADVASDDEANASSAVDDGLADDSELRPDVEAVEQTEATTAGDQPELSSEESNLPAEPQWQDHEVVPTATADELAAAAAKQNAVDPKTQQTDADELAVKPEDNLLPVEEAADPQQPQSDEQAGEDGEQLASDQARDARAADQRSDERRERGDRPERWFERDASEITAELAADAEATSPVELPSGPAGAANLAADASPAPNAPSPVAAEVAAATAEITQPASEPLPTNLAGALPSAPAASTETARSAEPSTNSPGTQGITAATRANRAVDKSGQAPQPGDQVDLSQQERVRLVQRVARSFARLGPDGGQIQLRLHPPQLGSLSVQVRLEGRSMTAKLTTENGAAREAIMESLPVLRSRLAEQGFEITQFQVDVAANGSDASWGGNQNQQAFDQAGGERDALGDYRRLARVNSRAVEADLPARDDPAANLMWQTHAGIDVQA